MKNNFPIFYSKNGSENPCAGGTPARDSVVNYLIVDIILFRRDYTLSQEPDENTRIASVLRDEWSRLKNDQSQVRGASV